MGGCFVAPRKRRDARAIGRLLASWLDCRKTWLASNRDPARARRWLREKRPERNTATCVSTALRAMLFPAAHDPWTVLDAMHAIKTDAMPGIMPVIMPGAVSPLRCSAALSAPVRRSLLLGPFFERSTRAIGRVAIDRGGGGRRRRPRGVVGRGEWESDY